MRIALVSSLLCVALPASAAGVELLRKNGVAVEASVEEAAEGLVVVTRFVPQSQKEPLHLYDLALPEGGVGFPTKVELAPGQDFKPAGPLAADAVPHVVEGVSVYPAGPVTLRLPVKPPDDAGPDTPIRLLVTYMACTEKSCLLPVVRKPVALTLAGEKIEDAPAPAVKPSVAAGAVDVEALAGAVAARLEEGRRGGIRWRRPHDRASLEAVLGEARAAGKLALLDFTGPSCVNCQVMAKTVFLLPEVRAAWNRGVPVEVDTDPPHEELAAYQQERFETQNRPLYVTIAPDGRTAQWNEVFAADDRASVTRFVAFLEGGTGSSAGTGDGSLWSFLLFAVLGGLFTLVMPCTYPMVPVTINIFTQESRGGRSTVKLAAVYGLGIVAAFTGLGVLITGVFGASLATLSGHPLTNLVIGVAFVLLGLALLEVFLLRLPGGLGQRADEAQREASGYVRMLVLGLTFAVSGFTCTAPFAGSVLAQGVATGRWLMPILGMVVYSGTIAVPFFVMGIAPTVLKKKLPAADTWMNDFKVAGALVELGAAAKFLAIADAAWGWGVFRRGPVLALWAALALALGLFLSGFVKLAKKPLPDEPEVPPLDPPKPGEISAARMLLVVACVTLALWLLHGLAGGHLGFVESFFPADLAPGEG
jgi:thiol:disulfide interchange protein